MKLAKAIAVLLVWPGLAVAQQSTNAGQAQTLPPALTATKDASAARTGFELGGDGQGVPAADGAVSAIDLYAPRLGLSYSTRPLFYWQTDSRGRAATFLLYDPTDNKIYEADVAGKSSLVYPEDAPELKPGMTYRWTVALKDDGAAAVPSARLTVVYGDERQDLKQQFEDLPGNGKHDRLERAQLFAAHWLWYDAVAAYTQLIADYPDDAALYQARAEIYSALPQTRELAAADTATARKK